MRNLLPQMLAGYTSTNVSFSKRKIFLKIRRAVFGAMNTVWPIWMVRRSGWVEDETVEKKCTPSSIFSKDIWVRVREQSRFHLESASERPIVAGGTILCFGYRVNTAFKGQLWLTAMEKWWSGSGDIQENVLGLGNVRFWTFGIINARSLDESKGRLDCMATSMIRV